MPYFLVLVSHVRTAQAYSCAYAYANRTSGNQALVLMTCMGVKNVPRWDATILDRMCKTRLTSLVKSVNPAF